MQYPVFTDNATILGDGTEEHPLLTGKQAAPGFNMDILFNDGGAIGASPTFTYDKVNDAIDFTGGLATSHFDVTMLTGGAKWNLEAAGAGSGGSLTGGTAGLLLLDMGGTVADTITLQDTEAGSGGIVIFENGGGGIFIQVAGQGGVGFQTLDLGSTVGDTISLTNSDPTSAGLTIEDVGAGVIIQTLATEKIGFFGKAPVAQQATPVLLGDVIALLQAYGLSA